MFIESASDAIDKLTFRDTINVSNVTYLLTAIVFCNSWHFTCATFDGRKWLHIDDMCQNLTIFQTSTVLLQDKKEAFFAIYVLDSEKDKITYFNSEGQTFNFQDNLIVHQLR